jgi:SAM-dependent methyltransferase
MVVRRLARKSIALLRAADERLFGRPYAHFDSLLRRAVAEDCATVLDVGCGAASPIRAFSAELQLAVGVDVHIPSLLKSRAERRHHAYCCLDVTRLAGTIAPRAFDCVLSIDVIEHLTREAGLELLRTLEGIARKRVVIFTPNGFLPQPATADNAHQEHISGWTAEEMRALGYEVFGINGWRPLRGMYADARRPRWLLERLSRLTERRFEANPRRAFQILCVKDVRGTGFSPFHAAESNA